MGLGVFSRRAWAAALMLALAGCGVKSNLPPPTGTASDAQQEDRSRPPQPLGQ